MKLRTTPLVELPRELTIAEGLPQASTAPVSARCFIMDNSVVDDTGHHLEYARRIARALDRHAKDVVVLANRKCEAKKADSVRIVPAFTQTFWEQYTPTRGLGVRLRKLARGARDEWRRIGDRVYQRHFALYMTRLRHSPNLRDAQVGAYASGVRPNSTPFLAFLAGHIVRVIRRRIFAYAGRARQILVSGLRTLRLLGLARFGVRAARRLLILAFALVAGIIGAPFALIGLALLFVVRLLTPNRSLGAELLNVMRREKAARDDVLFVPTAGAAEMDAVLAWLDRTPRGRVRILFRREIWLAGEVSKFALDSPRTREVKSRLSILSQMPQHDIRILVDTEALAEQYQALTNLPIEVLPIPSRPADSAPRMRDGQKSEVLVASLGDARTEKGFGFLPDMVQAALSDEDINVRFELQANVHPNNQEPEVFAGVAKLSAVGFGAVSLIREPLTPQGYAELLQRADVLLAPYSARAYGARSSGVFAEALAAGAPVVTTIGSWMDQVATQYYGAVLADAFQKASSALSGPLLVCATPELPLPVERKMSALHQIAVGLRNRLGAGVAEREGGAALVVGATRGRVFILVDRTIADAPGFLTSLERGARAERVVLSTRTIDAATAPEDLAAGVRLAQEEATAMGESLRYLLRDIAAARRDAARARRVMSWLWDETDIAAMIMQSRPAKPIVFDAERGT